MKILVTGAGGFLGGRLVESMLRLGQRELRLHYRRGPDQGSLQALLQQYPDATFEAVSANLLRPAELQRLVAGIDLIIHAAAAKRGAAADIFLNTVVGTRNLLDAAVAAGCSRIVLVSSFAVFRSADLATGAVLDEHCAVESDGLEKGAYGFAKVQQELLFRAYQTKHGFEYVILRPGVIYGPGDGAFSTRVGLKVGSLFFSLGGRCRLPLSYVENCADAIGLAALQAPSGATFSVVDDELPRCSEYLALYRGQVAKMRTVSVPHWLFALGVWSMQVYHRRSRGQLPVVFTTYIVRSMYRNFRYSNQALRRLGWRQRVSTRTGLQTTFAALRADREHEAR
jgi:nucleoside-diphosphate-sugar epimerase